MYVHVSFFKCLYSHDTRVILSWGKGKGTVFSLSQHVKSLCFFSVVCGPSLQPVDAEFCTLPRFGCMGGSRIFLQDGLWLALFISASFVGTGLFCGSKEQP